MKKKAGLLITLSLMSAPVFAADMDRATADLIVTLSASYKQNKDILIKKNIAVADFNVTGRTAAEENAGEAMRASVLSVLSQSTLFTVIDRRGMQAVLAEQELQQTGMTDQDKAVQTGKLLNADAIFSGSIVESGENLVITAKLTDTETGKTLSETITARTRDMIDLREEQLNRIFVRKEGVGITLHAMGQTITGNNSTFKPFPSFQDTGLYRRFGVELRYRFTENIMAGSGFNQLWGQVLYIPSQDWNVPAAPNASGTGEFTIDVKGYGIPLMLYFNYTPHRRVNLFAGAGIEYISLNLLGYFNGGAGGGKGFGVNQFGPELREETLLYRACAGIECFLTPRLALSFSAGYQYGKMSPDFSNQWHLPDITRHAGGDISLSGLTFQPSVSLYF